MQIHLLGGFRVAAGGREVGDGAWRLRKSRDLLKLLALADGHRLTREQVMEMLWPGFPPDAAANNLYRAVHFARRALSTLPEPCPTLRFEQGILSLQPSDGLWIDVEEFERGAESARAAGDLDAIERALLLYTGDLLPEDRYEEWAIRQRQALRKIYCSLLFSLARICEERGDLESSRVALDRVLDSDPAHEDAHVGLMRIYALLGQPHQAARQYRRLCEVLRRELDVEPALASRKLHQDIAEGRLGVSGQAPAPSSQAAPRRDAGLPRSPGHHPPGNLPASLTSFIGRERELYAVRALISSHRLVTIAGPGGGGKTRLVLEVAPALGSGYPDGVWLVELAELSDPELLAGTVMSALQIRESTAGRSVTASLVDALRIRRQLVVLDNCEHLIEAVAGLAETLLRACPQLHLLATSREALRVPGEAVWFIPPLAGPQPGQAISVEDVLRSEAVRLFIDRARTHVPGLQVSESDAWTILQICLRLEGMPLAIELAAARTRSLSVDEIARRLDDSLRLLTGGARTAPQRQRSLQATIDWSYALLTEVERRTLRRLAVFSGGCSLEAAEAVCASDDVTGQAVVEILSQLVDKSLLVVHRVDGQSRYRLLDPVRQYAGERLADAPRGYPDRDAVQNRHARYFTSLVERAEPALTGPEQQRWLDHVADDYDNFRAALRWWIEVGDASSGLTLGWALWRFWSARGYLGEGRHWLSLLLALPAAAEQGVMYARALFAQGVLASDQGDHESARESLAAGLAAAREVRDGEMEAGTLTRLGYVARMQGDFDEARACFTAGLEIRRRLGSTRDIAISLGALGKLAMSERDHQRARPLLEESLSLFREIGDTISVATVTDNLGRIASLAGDDERALAQHKESLRLFRQLGDEIGAAVSLFNLGRLALRGGEIGRASQLLGESLAIHRASGNRQYLPRVLEALAAVACARGEALEAERLLGASQSLRDRHGIPRPPIEQPGYEETMDVLRTLLPDDRSARAIEDARSIDPDDVLGDILGPTTHDRSG